MTDESNVPDVWPLLARHVFGADATAENGDELKGLYNAEFFAEDQEAFGTEAEEALAADGTARVESLRRLSAMLVCSRLRSEPQFVALEGDDAVKAEARLAAKISEKEEHVQRVRNFLRLLLADIPAIQKLIQRLIDFLIGLSDDFDDEDPTMPDHEPQEELRDKLLEKTAFDISTVPDSLKTEENQKIYVYAVIQALELLGREPDPDSDESLAWAASVTGLLLQEGVYDPEGRRFYTTVQRLVSELSSSAKENSQVQIDEYFKDPANATKWRMFAPDTDTGTQRISVFGKVFTALDSDPSLQGVPTFLQSFAATGRAMVDAYDQHGGDTRLLNSLARTFYGRHVSDVALGGGGAGGGVADVTLPPLHDPTGHSDEIDPENVKAVSAVYAVYQLERMMLHPTFNRGMELFMAGLLPISASDGSARQFDDYYWDQGEFLNEAARFAVYSRTLGAPGGQLGVDSQPNEQFNTRLMTFVSAIARNESERNISNLFNPARTPGTMPLTSTSGEFVRKAGRELFANASLRGWAGTAYSAERMANQVERMLSIFQLQSVRNAFGVTSAYQVVERLAQREFGVTPNVALHVTLADEVQTLMRIGANKHTVWLRTTPGKDLLSETTNNEGDLTYDETRTLRIASQHIRAVSGWDDPSVEDYAQPREVVASPSIPPSLGGAPGIGGVDLSGLDQIQNMVSEGKAPSLDQLRNLLPRL